MPVQPATMMRYGALLAILSIAVPTIGLVIAGWLGAQPENATFWGAVTVVATLLLFVAGVALAAIGFILRGVRGTDPESPLQP